MPPRKTTARKTTNSTKKVETTRPTETRTVHRWFGIVWVAIGSLLLLYLAFGLYVYLAGPNDGVTRAVTNVFKYPSASVTVPGYSGWYLLSVGMTILLVLSLAKLIFISVTGRMRELGKVVTVLFLFTVSVVALATSVPSFNNGVIGYNEQLDRVELLKKVQAQRQQAPEGQQAPMATDDQLEADGLNQLIRNRIILQEATKLDVKASRKEINDMYKQQADRLQGEDNLKKQLKDSLGWTPADFKREVVRYQILQQELNQKLTGDVELNKASKAKADELLAQVKAGKDFAEVAKNSDDPTAQAGIDSGFVKKGESDPTVEGVVFGLQPGQTSEVLKTERGFVIVRLEEKRGTDEVRYRQILIATKSLPEFFQEELKGTKVSIYVDGLEWDGTLYAVVPENANDQPQAGASPAASPLPASAAPAAQ